MMLGKDASRRLLESAMACRETGEAREAEALFTAGRSLVTRWAGGRIHQNTSVRMSSTGFRLAMGRSVGVSRMDGCERMHLEEGVRRAEEIARRQPEDPDFPGFAKSPPAEAVSSEPADEIGPEEAARALAPAIELALASGAEPSGSLTADHLETAVSNTLGTFQHHAESRVHLNFVASAEGAEGASVVTARRLDEIDFEGAARRAVERALASRRPVEIEPGDYPVVLEPAAVAVLIEMLAWMGMGAQPVLEGHSFICGREGVKACSEKITIIDDGLDPRGELSPFDAEGVPRSRTTIIGRGVVLGPVYDTRTAAIAGVESTGHAVPEPNVCGPFPRNLRMEPGLVTQDEMIRCTSRGLLVTNFHYTNPVDSHRTVLTGMTRFGTFLIEDGKIAGPVRSMRFTENLLEALRGVEMVGDSLHRKGATLAPALKLSKWRFTGATGE